MVEATTFNDEVIAISADVVPNYYTIPDSVEDYAVYMCPTGATVEEISVFAPAVPLLWRDDQTHLVPARQSMNPTVPMK